VPSPPQDSRQSRRDLLKKAAIGGGVSVAVWAAPKVEGRGLVPDYAAASTLTGCQVFVTKDCATEIPTQTLLCGGVGPAGIEITAAGTLAAADVGWQVLPDAGCCVTLISCSTGFVDTEDDGLSGTSGCDDDSANPCTGTATLTWTITCPCP